VISFEDFDLMARGGTIALLGVWSWTLIRDFCGALAARLALVMNVAIICHVIATIPGQTSNIAALDVLFDAGSSAVFGAFWLVSRAWFDDTVRFTWRSWAIAIAPTLLVAAIDIFLIDKMPSFSLLWFTLLRSMWFLLGLSGLWVAWRGRADDLVEPRRVLRLQLVAAIGGLALMVNSVEIAVFAFGAPESLRSVTQFSIFITSALLCAAMFRLREQDLFAAFAPPAAAPSPRSDDPLAVRLIAHMESELPHRDEEMTIAKLASQLGEQEYRLRRLINQHLRYRNFSQFLNGFRLREVKAALTDPSQKSVPILTIALDAGFGSLGPFNRAFREAEGITPSAYRNLAS
jgi:AraC-like DNA-binding protein